MKNEILEFLDSELTRAREKMKGYYDRMDSDELLSDSERSDLLYLEGFADGLEVAASQFVVERVIEYGKYNKLFNKERSNNE